MWVSMRMTVSHGSGVININPVLFNHHHHYQDHMSALQMPRDSTHCLSGMLFSFSGPLTWLMWCFHLQDWSLTCSIIILLLISTSPANIVHLLTSNIPMAVPIADKYDNCHGTYIFLLCTTAGMWSWNHIVTCESDHMQSCNITKVLPAPTHSINVYMPPKTPLSHKGAMVKFWGLIPVFGSLKFLMLQVSLAMMNTYKISSKCADFNGTTWASSHTICYEIFLTCIHHVFTYSFSFPFYMH